MLEVFSELLVNAKISNSWIEAYITLIPKEDTDLQQVKNYRLISLLNADYKIFASLMVNRLKRLLNEFIHTDQNSFLPKRQIRDNIRTILNTLEYYEAHPEKQMALMFLDGQKAFDNSFELEIYDKTTADYGLWGKIYKYD